ncbi:MULTISPECIES: thioesterase II family protein [unclassified Acinetobacter]|uniref:thioesterase II family protein n=1 Tax=unclassified Acinetobacter TaxID=196816 RepID=UPI0018EB8FB5|nr:MULTISPECIES: thioesterase [unclassified Acinetobacter]MBJ6352993.1 thioesterase [Acinetobacter sp. c1]MBM0958612.1 thioesterase [Acinetobacter sp. C13]
MKNKSLILICFTYAGGTSALFSKWKKYLSDDITIYPITYPGRENRYNEPRETDFLTLSKKLNESLDSVLENNKFAIYGHSMGAWFAHQLALYAEKKQLRPEILLVSGQRAPHLSYPFPSAKNLDDKKLLEFIQSFGAIDQSLLSHPEWVNYAISLLRDDLALCESHQPVDVPLECPIHVFCNEQDPLITLDLQQAWHIHTQSRFTTSFHMGDHFFIRNQSENFLTTLSKTVENYIN